MSTAKGKREEKTKLNTKRARRSEGRWVLDRERWSVDVNKRERVRGNG